MKRKLLAILMIGIAACGTTPFQDGKELVLDPPNKNLRGHSPDGKDDRPESTCDPMKKPDGSLEYQCVVHFMPDYQRLLDKITELESQVQALEQQGCHL